ncbi:alpha/beta hydrolase [Thalassotalea sp. HSM 43]|uniref:alpha/beta hydrolase n=1 Tax=Thalassotalea sp. HSM 43 TaxID=2552945 RepID=UPI00167216DF|nr:alpha/beta hydrolase [Thalassotalea sp. HSM 43]
MSTNKANNNNNHNISAIRFDLPQISLHGLEIGNPDGKTILCLHGWLDNAASFLPLFEQLQQSQSALLSRCRFIAIDWPGHGLSDHRGGDAHYHFVDYVDDLYQLLHHLKLQKITLLGHSMGGMVSTLFAGTFAEKVEQLLLIESVGLITETDEPGKLLRQGIESRAKQSQKNKTLHKDIDSAVKARMNVSDLDYDSAQKIVSRATVDVDGGVRWRSDPRLRTVSLMRFALPQAQHIVSQISAPVTLIKGDQGFAMIDQGLTFFGKKMRNLNTVTFAGGHHVHMQQAQQLSQLLEQILG